MSSGAKARLFLGLFWICGWPLVADSAAVATQAETNRLEFGIFWPPKAPSETRGPGVRPLLNGCLLIRSEHLSNHSLMAHLRIVLSRPSDEAGREFWNSRLAFPEYDWMRYVRAWDKDNRWLWPNLPYLLRLHGLERVERYGGVDPAKGVDNDFAAVLIRKYDESDEREDPVTERRPLVAAEWYPAGGRGEVNKQTIVHTAQSDEFTLHLAGAEGQPRGMAAIWIIYADFMGAKLPETWPKVPEFAGGILAYFELHWDLKTEVGQEISFHQVVPKRGTGFDWEQWTPRTRAAEDSKSTAKLVDVEPTRTGSSKPQQPGKVEHGTAPNAAPPHR